MKYLINKNWIILLVFIGLLSVKYYYLYLSNLNNTYSNDVVYNNGDASHYLVIGKNIADFNVYSDTNSKTISESATWRPPFWPLVLSLFFKFTSSPFVLILLKSIFEMGLLLFALFKFKNISNLKLIYLVPFFLLLVEPQYLKYSITFLSESLTAILILLLTVFFISINKTKKQHIAIPILSALVILCQPVSVFFVLSLFIIYLLLNLKSNFLGTIGHGLLFSVLLLAWPFRNQVTFDKGFYMTASQGAALSKGWNEKVATQFTNVDGDLADEGLNLKFVDNNLLQNADNSVLTRSKLYSIGTINFIKSIGFKEKINIAFKKLKSNFNPFPEKSKPGFLETISIFFRMLYLFTFIQLIVRFFKKEKTNYNSTRDRVYLVVLAVFIGQIVMSVYVYTGLRFNSIYSLTMLFCFIYLNHEFLIKMYKKLIPIKVQTLMN
jgi:hypothetical protein